MVHRVPAIGRRGRQDQSATAGRGRGTVRIPDGERAIRVGLDDVMALPPQPKLTPVRTLPAVDGPQQVAGRGDAPTRTAEGPLSALRWAGTTPADVLQHR
jgi:hypothetical protein